MQKITTLDQTTLYRQIEVLKETVNRLQSKQEHEWPAQDAGKQENIRELRILQLRLQAGIDMLQDYERDSYTEDLARQARDEVEDMNIDFKDIVCSLTRKP